MVLINFKTNLNNLSEANLKMKNKKVTLKSLQEQLENLKIDGSKKVTKAKTSKPVVDSHKSNVAPDIKHSYIQNLHMRSSMYYLWLLSWIIYYANKIPYISRIVTFLSLIYGRTTWWKILMRVRKLFVVFNAIIGMYVVYKTTGFGVDSFWVNFIALGEKYVDIFVNFNKTLFNWIFELFDYKIVPGGNPPKIKPSALRSGGLWRPWLGTDNVVRAYNPDIANITSNINELKPDWFKNPYGNNIKVDSSYTTIGTIVYYTSLLLGAAVVLGTCYLGYKLVTDPGYIGELVLPKRGYPDKSDLPEDIASSSSLDEGMSNVTGPSSVTKTVAFIFAKLGAGVSTAKDNLNPFSWFKSSSDIAINKRLFLENQTVINTADHRYYPFTPNNPYDSFFERMRIHYLGETIHEKSIREMICKGIHTHYGIGVPLPGVGSATPLSSLTPSIGNIGLNINIADTWNSDGPLEKIFKSFPGTPNFTPYNPPMPLPNVNLSDISTVNPSWMEHKVTGEIPGGKEVIDMIKNKGKGKFLDPNNTFSPLSVESTRSSAATELD